MRNWLIYEPPGGARPTLEGVEKFETVREGFSKAAFVLAPFWLGWRRCWLALVVWAAGLVVVAALFRVAGVRGGPGVLLLLLPNLAVGLEAAWIRARALERRGYALVGSMLARSREEAEAVFFQDWVSKTSDEPAASPRSAPYQPAAGGVLGLFPQPGAAR